MYSDGGIFSDDGKVWSVYAKSSVDLSEIGGAYWAKTNEAYKTRLVERKALAKQIRNDSNVSRPLCLGRDEEIFARFFQTAVWVRADEKQKCVGLAICIHFLECLREGTRRPLSPKSFFVEGKAGTGKSLCVVSMIRTFAGTVLCDELKMLTREQLSQKIIVTSYLNVAANVLNESTFSSSILNTINPLSAIARDLSHVLLFIVDEIHTVTIDAVKGMQEAFVRLDFGGGGNDRIFFDGASKVFIGDVSQPHAAAKSGITCPVDQFRTYMSEKMDKRRRKLEIGNESLGFTIL